MGLSCWLMKRRINKHLNSSLHQPSLSRMDCIILFFISAPKLYISLPNSFSSFVKSFNSLIELTVACNLFWFIFLFTYFSTFCFCIFFSSSSLNWSFYIFICYFLSVCIMWLILFPNHFFFSKLIPHCVQSTQTIFACP